jgi:hypothetical protein
MSSQYHGGNKFVSMAQTPSRLLDVDIRGSNALSKLNDEVLEVDQSDDT